MTIKRLTIIDALKSEEVKVEVPKRCPHCRKVVKRVNELGLVLERMRCDEDGDGFESEEIDRIFVVGIECGACDELIAGVRP